MTTRSQTSDPADLGTKELARRLTLKPELVSQKSGHAVHLRVVDEAPIDRLLLQDIISLREHNWSMDLARDLWRARMSGVVASNWQPRISSDVQHVTPSWARALSKLHGVLRWLDSECGPSARQLCVAVLVNDASPSGPMQLEMLRAALLSYVRFSEAYRD